MFYVFYCFIFCFLDNLFENWSVAIFYIKGHDFRIHLCVFQKTIISKLIDFDTTLDEYEQEDLKNLLINFITSNKLLTPIDC